MKILATQTQTQSQTTESYPLFYYGNLALSFVFVIFVFLLATKQGSTATKGRLRFWMNKVYSLTNIAQKFQNK